MKFYMKYSDGVVFLFDYKQKEFEPIDYDIFSKDELRITNPYEILDIIIWFNDNRIKEWDDEKEFLLWIMEDGDLRIIICSIKNTDIIPDNWEYNDYLDDTFNVEGIL